MSSGLCVLAGGHPDSRLPGLTEEGPYCSVSLLQAGACPVLSVHPSDLLPAVSADPCVPLLARRVQLLSLDSGGKGSTRPPYCPAVVLAAFTLEPGGFGVEVP